jgi:hypothetical protein
MISQHLQQLDERLSKLPSDHDQDEPSRDGAFQSLLVREDLSDVTLRGSDGTLVIANRCILASRSSVFYGMLYGPFKEASNTVVNVGYAGTIIQAIVNYIYTNKLSTSPTISRNFQHEKEDTSNEGKMKLVHFLVALMDASEFFALSTLRRMIELSAKKQMLRKNKLAIFFMAACAPDCDTTQCLRDTALGLVKIKPDILFDGLKSVVALIHPSYVEEILKQERLTMNEYSCFRILQAWATAEVESSDHDNNNNNVSMNASTEATNDWPTNRKRVASEMIRHIHLENISPMDLSTVVASSGLVSAEQLCVAYKTQALRYEKADGRMRTVYEYFRGTYVWIQSGTNTVVAKSGRNRSLDVLDCPVMTSGVHKWKIQVVKGKGCELVVLTTRPSDGPLLRSDLDAYYQRQEGWTVFEGQTLHYRGNVDEAEVSGRLPCKLNVGSIVSFSLYIDRGGILTVSIDGSTPCVAFSGMCRGHDVEEGFLPAVDVWDGEVKFLGFEHV